MKAMRLKQVQTVWLETYWDVYCFNYSRKHGVIWPVHQSSFANLKRDIDADLIAYSVVDIEVKKYKKIIFKNARKKTKTRTKKNKKIK